MGFSGKTAHLCIYPQVLQSDEDVLPLLDITAVIIFAVNDQRGRGGISNGTHGRLFPEILIIFPRGFSSEFHLKRPVDIAGSPHAEKVAHASLGDSGPEVVGMADDPVSHIPSVASPGDPHALLSM